MMVDAPLFEDAFAKLERARHHLANLQAEFLAYSEAEIATAHAEYDGQKWEIVFRWNPPKSHSAMLGDVIHNMRTSLDLLACELARLNNRSDSDVYFPIAREEEALKDAIKSSNFKRAGDDAVELLKTLKPYRGGNEFLRSIHELDRIDKHKALVPCYRVVDFQIRGQFDLTNKSPQKIPLDSTNFRFQFEENGPFGGRNIIQTLEVSMQAFESILEAFKSLVELRTATG